MLPRCGAWKRHARIVAQSLRRLVKNFPECCPRDVKVKQIGTAEPSPVARRFAQYLRGLRAGGSVHLLNRSPTHISVDRVIEQHSNIRLSHDHWTVVLALGSARSGQKRASLARRSMLDGGDVFKRIDRPGKANGHLRNRLPLRSALPSFAHHFRFSKFIFPRLSNTYKFRPRISQSPPVTVVL